jgi:hypothetical protein
MLKGPCLVAFIVLFQMMLSFEASAGTLSDTHMEGYALSILEQNFAITSGSVTVREGIMTVVVPKIGKREQERLTEALRTIRGVKNVVVVIDQGQTSGQENVKRGVPVADTSSHWFPSGRLFEPLHADPRWPHFAATIRSYSSSGEGGVNTGFAGDFGETLAIYRGGTASHKWDVGIQAGVFSLFDVENSKHLLNADYIVAALTSYRSGNISMFLRYFHQSSHLGDEFITFGRGTRTNVSYEMVDAKISYDVSDSIRLYGGVGTLVRKDPSDLGKWRTQYGIEMRGPSIISRRIRPVAYSDFQTVQQNGNGKGQWLTNISVRAGFEYESFRILGRSIQLLAEYYSGRSPNGQFYTQRIETIGLGLHVYF